MDNLADAKRLFLDALALQEKGDLEQAMALYEKALERAPGRPSILNNLAAIYLARERFHDARRLLERVLETEPDDELARLNLGNCQARLNETEAAIHSYGRVLLTRPDHADALNNRGNALLTLRRPEAALADYDRALAVRPDHADTLYNRGNALMKLGRHDDALASYDRALAFGPADASTLNNRGLVLRALNRRGELIENYRKLLDAAPDFPYARGYFLRARLDCCEWGDYQQSVEGLVQAVRSGRRADSPFHFLAISDSPSDQLRCARICADDEYPPAAEPVWRGERYEHDRIRVAYVSADFHEHAVPNLIAGLLELHDRARFHITALSIGPDRRDAMRSRLVAAVDRFVDVSAQSDDEVARLMRESEIDIAVDLQGYTQGCRTGIFARRAAPVQVNYLGYPGTMGATYMDYILADRHVIPPQCQGDYAEKVVWLPDCYQVNDAKREIADRAPTRTELGLPDNGFVFCCFNNNYKVAPRVFDLWMRLLNKVEGSVLWLLEDNAVAARNLRQAAQQRGVAPDRLVFAPRMSIKEHLARQRRADLFLDTLPYNAHVTASDALWAGLPVLTCQGTTFAGRVAASLLQAAGIEDLVTADWNAYEQLALNLATDAPTLTAIRSRLARNRSTCALFDTDLFRRHIEAAYVTMCERVRSGQAPVSFTVAPSRNLH
jgi:protein O-GlcNAc transferase